MGIYIRFDWAMKRLLRNKANHAVLEGLMASLLGRKYTILRFFESGSNQENELDSSIVWTYLPGAKRASLPSLRFRTTVS